MATIRKFSFTVLLAAACSGGSGGGADSAGTGVESRTLFTEPSAVIEAERGMILGIRIGMPEDSIRKVLGEPLRSAVEGADSAARTVLEFPMGTVRSAGPRGVTGFLCGGDDCRTSDGVGIEDSLDLVLSTYGPTPPRGPAESPEALDYRLGITDCNLTFTLSSGRVTSLELGCAAP